MIVRAHDRNVTITLSRVDAIQLIELLEIADQEGKIDGPLAFLSKQLDDELRRTNKQTRKKRKT